MRGDGIQDTLTVLVTGAGGAAFPFIATTLRGQGYRVIAADMDNHAVGLHLADKGYVIPSGDSPRWLPAVEEICRRENVSVLLPLVDEELLPAWGASVPVILPRPEFIELCLDKYKLMKALPNTPKTILASDRFTLDFPVIVKPRRGRGSRGVMVAHTESELASVADREDLLIQDYIEGTEYTVSVVLWRDGDIQAIVPKEIICKRGITRLAVTKRNKKIDRLCEEIQDKLKADGPFNAQLKINKEGEPILFEINPRYSTTTTLTAAAGVDEIGGLIKQSTGGQERIKNNWREGVVLMRQMVDKFVDISAFREIEVVS
jgi:carbamoyl-phosphate synthase large subunit